MAYTLPNEIELLKQLIRGDATAFRTIYEFYRGRIYAFALFHTKSKDSADEIVQEVFIKLWEKREQVDAIQNFDAYIKTITRNHIYNVFKKMAKDRSLQQKVYENMQLLKDGSADLLLEKELERLHKQAVEQLPGQQKIVYTLSREEELTYEQIAEKLGISKYTVKNHMAAALKSVRDHIDKHPDLACVIIAILMSEQ